MEYCSVTYSRDTGIVPYSTDNRLMKEKLVTVLAEAGLTQMQRDPTSTRARTYWIYSVVTNPH